VYNNKKKITGCIALVIMLSAFYAALARSEVVVWQQGLSVTSKMTYPAMIDDFNDGTDPNGWGGMKTTSVNGAGAVITAVYDAANAYGGTGYCLKLDYNVPNASNYATMYMPLRPDWSGVDVTTYSYISFMAKGTGAEKSFKLQLVSSDNGNNAVYTLDYSTMTAAWQEIKIPFSVFTGVNMTKLSQINFIFEHDYFASRVYPYAGTVYLDNLTFKFN